MLELTVNSAHITRCPPGWTWDNPGNPRDEVNLWLVTEGAGRMEIGGTTYALGPGSCFFIRMGEPCRGRHDRRNPLTVMWSLCRLRQGWPGELQRPPLYRQLSNLPFVSQLYSLAIAAHQDPRLDRREAGHLMRALYLAVAEEDRQLEASQGDTRLIQIHQVARRLRSSPGQAYRIPDLARECSCSTGHFTRLFRQATGLPPRAFITQARIETARSLLRGSNHKIAHLAGLLGYGDIFHFSRQFKEQTGLSPSQYRA